MVCMLCVRCLCGVHVVPSFILCDLHWDDMPLARHYNPQGMQHHIELPSRPYNPRYAAPYRTTIKAI